MVPVAALTDRPAGRPVAVQVKPAPGAVLVAVPASGSIAVPSLSERAPGFATVTVLVMVQVKPAEPLAPEPSVTMRVTKDVPAALGEPVMVPVAAPMASPAGRPVADQVRVAIGAESVARSAKGLIAGP